MTTEQQKTIENLVRELGASAVIGHIGNVVFEAGQAVGEQQGRNGLACKTLENIGTEINNFADRLERGPFEQEERRHIRTSK